MVSKSFKTMEPRAFKFLVSFGFLQSKHDYSLFVKAQGSLFTVALVYVDDI